MKVLLAVVMCLVLCGCPFSAGEGMKHLRKDMTQIEVKQNLGEPSRTSTKGETESWYYCFADTKMARFIGYCSTYVFEFANGKLFGWGRQREYEQQEKK